MTTPLTDRERSDREWCNAQPDAVELLAVFSSAFLTHSTVAMVSKLRAARSEAAALQKERDDQTRYAHSADSVIAQLRDDLRKYGALSVDELRAAQAADSEDGNRIDWLQRRFGESHFEHAVALLGDYTWTDLRTAIDEARK